MESAIPRHLQCPRTRNRRADENYAPPYPAYAAGYDNMVAIAYWSDPASFARWRVDPVVDAWWNADERFSDGLGYFREIACPRFERYETLFNTPDRPEGVSVVMGGMREDIQEHAYWGAARDRIPLSQTDAMQPAGALATIH